MKILPAHLPTYIWILTLGSWFGLPGEQVKAQQDASMMIKVKAAYLYAFPKFVTWSHEKLGQPESPIVLGILGGTEGKKMKALLDSVVDDRGLIQDRQVQVHHFEYVEPNGSHPEKRKAFINELNKCHILYIDGNEDKINQDIFALIETHQVLTVGSGKTFLSDGGMVALVLKGESIIFKVNLAPVTKEGLVISPKLLSRAELIR